jgi:hypothetical protein
MPVKRLNFTSRKRIRRDDVDLTLRQVSGGAISFDAFLRLSDYDFPPDACVIVEAYRQTLLMRFNFGTVSVPMPAADRQLSLFEDETEVLFRVRVTAASGRPGLLLGEADQLRPGNPSDEPDRRIALLPPVPADIGEEVWRVDFETKPMLFVSKDLADWKQTVRTDSFRALVYPAALRSILERILKVEKFDFTDDLEDWRALWLLFASRIPGVGSMPRSHDEHDDWIENAVGAFARSFRMRTKFSDELRGVV